MGKCISKSRKTVLNPMYREGSEQYSHERACDKANKIQEEADALIEEGNIMEAYYKYRAFYWIMREVLEKCPASYKPVAKESVK